MMNKEDLLKRFSGFLDDIIGDTKNEKEVCDVAKSIDEDKRLFTAVVLRPEVVDSHGDIYSTEVVEKACHDYTQYCMNTNLQHTYDLIKSDMAIVESYISPANMQLGEGEVFKGDWIMTARIENDELWEACKSGIFTGFSVGCSALTETLED